MRILAIVLLIITILVLALYAYKNTTNKMPSLPFGQKGDKKDKKKDKKEESTANVSYEIIQQIDMPAILTEVSDISNVDDKSFACIQDEQGVIYVFNTTNSKIEKEIPFAAAGDYEGIALKGNTAYVVNSSGVIYEVSDITKNKPSVEVYQTGLTEKDDVEALCYDKANDRLLLAFKGEEGNGESKGIYSFDLKTKQLEKSPVYSISNDHPSFDQGGGKKKQQGLKPSAIAIHPTSGDIYITEGTNPRMVVLDKQGKFKSLVELNEKDFPQPEGITFNSAGEMFISNEGKKGLGNILKVEL